MFKKTLLATATTAALLGPVAAFAVGEMGQGTINFAGTVIDAPCSIVAADANMAVDLGQATLRDLKAAGQASTPVPIVIHLTGCSFDANTPATNPATYKFSKVAVSFTGATTVAAQGQLANTGTATNVVVQLMGPNYVSPVDMSAAATAGAVANQVLTTGDNTISFFARLIATAAGAKVGTVKSSITYNLNYF